MNPQVAMPARVLGVVAGVLLSATGWALPPLDQVPDAGYCDPLPSAMQVSVLSQCPGCSVEQVPAAADDKEDRAALLHYPAGSGRIVMRFDLQAGPVTVDSGVIGALLLAANPPKAFQLEIRLISNGTSRVGRGTTGSHPMVSERSVEFYTASAAGSFDAIEFDYQVISPQPTTLQLLEVCTQ